MATYDDHWSRRTSLRTSPSTQVGLRALRSEVISIVEWVGTMSGTRKQRVRE